MGQPLLGQRVKALNEPVYVCRKDMTANTVTVGPEQALFDRELWETDVGQPLLGQRVKHITLILAPVQGLFQNIPATVTVGPEQALFDRELWANDMNWISIDRLSKPMRVPLQKGGIIPIWDKADVLTVRLFGIAEALDLRNTPNLRFA